MKTTLALLVTAVLLAACGGGSDGDTGGDGDGSTGVPTIAAISGSGADGAVLDTIEVTGDHFAAPPNMEVYLVGVSTTVALDFAVESASKFSASLPTDVVPGDYTLEVSNSLGKADAPLSLLKGEPGDPGISIAHQWYCSAGADLDPSGDEMRGVSAYIWEFSDQSFFITCMTDRIYIGVTDSDSAYAVSFVPATLAAANPDLIAAVAMYVNCQFTPETAIMRYSENGNAGNYSEVACSQSY